MALLHDGPFVFLCSGLQTLHLSATASYVCGTVLWWKGILLGKLVYASQRHHGNLKSALNMYSSFKIIILSILSFPVRLAFLGSEAGMVTAYTFDSHEFSISLSVSFGPWSVASQLRRARCWMDPLLLVKIELKLTISEREVQRRRHNFWKFPSILNDASMFG